MSGPQPLVGGRGRRIVVITLVLFVALAIATIGLSPAVPLASYPGSEDAARARQLLDQLRVVQARGTPTPVMMSKAQLRSTAAVVGQTLGYDRIAFDHRGDHLVLSASVPLRWGTWLNVRARIEPSKEGFPDMPARIGWLPIPAVVTRFGLGLARRWAAHKDNALPPLDQLVQRLQIEPGRVLATVSLPSGGAFQRLANGLRPDPIDATAVAAVYCRLAEAERDDPSDLWPLQVRRAFADARSPQENRAAMVALAILAVGPEAGAMAGDAAQRVRGCALPPSRFLLLNRPDLPKHWALSAALASAYGDAISTQIGVWKEVADSGAGGSGFSFVDLAADRSGIYYAKAASDPLSAQRTARRLATIEEEELMPVKALALAEGITEAKLLERYGDTGSRQFAAASQRIDRILASALP